jgi:hypothetical protein
VIETVVLGLPFAASQMTPQQLLRRSLSGGP